MINNSFLYHNITMNTKKKYIPLIFIFIIMIFSLLNNYNARFIDPVYSDNLYKQISFFLIGFIFIYLISKVRLTKIYKYHYIYYTISIILLVLVLFFGKSVNGAKAWFDFKIISFQPSELCKLTLALTLAKITMDFNKTHNKKDIIFLLKITILTIILSILVFIEPDTGAIIFYFLIYLTSFFSAKIKKRWRIIFFLSLFIFISFFTYLYFFNQELLINLIGTSFFYRIDRITNLNDNYQINNALTLIGSTSLLGVGINKTVLYIPEAPTDFMFAYNFGNFGLLAAVIVTICYLLLCITLLLQTLKTKDNIFNKMFLSNLFFAIIYNIFMNIGVLPIMGITLPFLSYGGSSLLITFIMLSIALKSTS